MEPLNKVEPTYYPWTEPLNKMKPTYYPWTEPLNKVKPTYYPWTDPLNKMKPIYYPWTDPLKVCQKIIDDYRLIYPKDLFEIKLIFYDPRRILQISEFVWTLRSSV